MARTRQRKSSNSSKSTHRTHVEKLRALSRRGIQVDPTSKAATARAYRKEFPAAIPKDYQHKATKEQRAMLKERGFFVTKKTVVIDRPRNAQRDKIKGARFSILKSGTIKFSVKQRRDYTYGLTKKEKKQFAESPDSFIKDLLARLKTENRTLRDSIRPAIRLTWGAFQGTKSFSASYFTKNYFGSVSPEEERNVKNKRKRKKRLDKLTGITFVVHVPKRRKKHG